jgi:hypothetical protein
VAVRYNSHFRTVFLMIEFEWKYTFDNNMSLRLYAFGSLVGRCSLHRVPGTHKGCWGIGHPVHTWGGAG